MDNYDKKLKPNVLFITIDCLRPDFLGCYNNSDKNVSPTIDSLAETGNLFTNAFANASQTPISFPSLFTANYPFSYGGPNYLSSERIFIAEWFKQQGYHTAGFSTNAHLSYTNNYPKGFDYYQEYYRWHQKVKDNAKFQVEKGISAGKSLETLESEIQPVLIQHYDAAINGIESYIQDINQEPERIKDALTGLKYEKELLVADFENFAQEIGANLSRPSFMYRVYQYARSIASSYSPARGVYQLFQSIDCSPRDKPMTDAEEVTDDVVSYLQNADTDDQPLYLWMHYMDAHLPYLPGSSENWENEYQQYLDAINESVSFRKINEQEFNVSKILYKACIRYIDTQLQRVIDTARKLERNTIVVITADHGEEFREHGDRNHKAKLYDELIRVPLIVSDLDEAVGQTYSRLISHVDILPSIYHKLIPGASIPGSVEGKDVSDTEREVILSETLRTAQSPRYPDDVGRLLDFDYKRIAARSHDEKMIYYEDNDSWQYYNLNDDPVEQTNLLPEEQNESLRDKILDHQQRIKKLQSYGEQQQEQPQIIQDRLQDLGYKM